MATPWNDCPYGKSNANTFVRARAYRIFLTSCVGINLGDTPRGLRHPRGVPSVDPPHSVVKSYTHLASLKYCYIAGKSANDTVSQNRFRFGRHTEWLFRMPQRIWRVTKMQPSTARSGHHISCSLSSLHFLFGILTSHPVVTYVMASRMSMIFACPFTFAATSAHLVVI